MTRLGMLTLIVFLMLLCAAMHGQQPKAAAMRPLDLKLEAVTKAIAAGTTPVLRLTIRNDGKAPEKVLKLRGDLQDTYFDVEITQNGKRVEVPRAISDPGIFTDDDFVVLQPGEKIVHELTRYATGFHLLRPGGYELRVRFWRPGESWEKSYLSPPAILRVER